MKALLAHGHNLTSLVDLAVLKAVIKRTQTIKRKATRKEVARAVLFAGIHKSDKFTAEAAHKAFAGYTAKKRSA